MRCVERFQADTAALIAAAHRLDNLIHNRRAFLAARPAAAEKSVGGVDANLGL
jgi:hypothetical protein